jgi:peptidoglycan-N-acetylglucosamine deacetylase
VHKNVFPIILGRLIYPRLHWSIPGVEKTIYLTFDDGPTPRITQNVMDILENYNAKATFFCLGKNVQNFPDLYGEIEKRGHTTGNHTYSHLDGWKTTLNDYLADIERCRKLVKTRLFRPPYGRIKPWQAKHLSENYKIIMWNVLSYDYERTYTPDQCAEHAIKNAGNGSIVVFHDSLKAEFNCLNSLPPILEHFTKKGFRFESIDHSSKFPNEFTST